ncbi:TonB-dependent receptor [Fulvivirga sediminis]|uniref:TonB-dependent receptor n=1 Tax=Fulvivirga sediminis TaxID=2803949 RepID=A0A937K312_9BACT|nr:TonB-dependent receptor [Fulvivirga sediminis]MBL3658930.1 TonB-dependent receptor [Fulvivirga sediminis]
MNLNLTSLFRIVIIMAVRLFFIYLVTLQVALAHSSAGQRLDETFLELQVTDASLKEVIGKVQELTPFHFAFHDGDLNSSKKYSFYEDKVSLKQVLEELAKEEGITFRRINNTISIKRQKDLWPPKVAVVEHTVSNGGISGHVKDQESGTDLIGASVVIEGKNYGAVSDINGNFYIKNVPAGEYALIISYVGYNTRKLEGIKVLADNNVEILVELSPNTQELSEVVVTADIPVQYAPIKNSTEISLVSNIKAETGIVTGISSQQISQSLDRDAADVMQRVPGVNLMNNFVLVRGLSQRYTMTYINGMMAPSTEEDQRAFSFNVLPSGLIDNIMVYKSPAPELRGGFSGGVIKVSTKQPSAARRIQVSFSGQYREGSSFEDAYSNSGATGQDWLGGGLEDRKYPDKFYDPNYRWEGIQGNPYAQRAVIDEYPKPYNLERDKYDFDKRLRINYYDSWKIGEVRLNNLTSVGYTSQSQFITGKTNGNSVPAISYEEAEINNLDWEGTDSLYNKSVRLSALESIGLNINKNHSVAFTGFYNRSVDDETNLRDQKRFVTSTNYNDVKLVNYEYSVQDLWTAQLSGEHTLGQHQFSWRAGKNYASRQAPDIQSFQFNTTHSMEVRGSTDRVLRRGSMFTDEDGTTYGLDYRTKIKDQYLVKSGVMRQQQQRDFESWYYLLDKKTSTPGEYDLQSPDDLIWFHLSEAMADSLYINPETGEGLYIYRDYSEGKFSVDNNYTAAYLGTEIPFINKKFQLNAGLRYEAYERHLYDELGRELITSNGYDRETGNARGDTLSEGPKQEYLLPSASLNWNILDNMRLTASYGKTIDRPAYRETAPFQYYDFGTNTILLGDASLKDATIHNYDLRWEYYPTEGEFLAVGAFYKDMNDIVETANRPTNNESGYIYATYVNTPEATVKGIELEVRKSLRFIPWHPMKYFSVIANYALIKNEIKPDLTLDEVPGDGKKRTFVGGAPYMLNANLYFEQPEWGTTFSVLVNSIGDRMIVAPAARRSPIYEQGRTTLDLVFQQKLASFLTLKAGVQNLLDAKILQYRDQNMDGKFDPDKIQTVSYYQGGDTRYGIDYITREFKMGRYYSLGFTIEL